MAERVHTNDVKKGWQVWINGLTAKVMDNRKGNLRMIQYLPNQGMFDDIGDEYVFRWGRARENENAPWKLIEFTPEQRKFERSVKQQMGSMRGW